MNKITLLAAFFLSALTVFGQKSRYVVYFTDKNDNPYSIDAPEDFLSARAILRRDRMGIPVSEQDLPVNPHYVDSLKIIGIETHFTSRWFNLVLIEATDEELAQINQISIVDEVIYVAPGEKLSSGRLKFTYKFSQANAPQNAFHNIDQMHSDGFTGEGIWIAVMDGGFSGVNTINPFQHLYNNNRMVMVKNFVENDDQVYQYSDHGTKVLSLIAGYEEGEYVAGAYNAHIGLFVTEDVATEYRIEEYNWLFAAEMADSAGFDIINTSLGYNTFSDPSMNYTYEDMDGQTTVISRASNMASARGILTVTSAGNEGTGSWKYITAPADAFGNLSVGAVDLNGNKASFSSIGPSADGRIKPDISAYGSGVSVINSSGNIVTGSGTSFAAPVATSILAGIWQRFPSLSLLGLRELAFDWSSQSNEPNNMLGFGVLKYGGAEEVTSIDEEIVAFHIYPNPVDEYLNFYTEIKPDDVMIYDQSGKIIDASVKYENKIDVSGLSSGVYLLKIKSGDKLFISKFVKK